jgi:trimeric autotransporter adhesin
MYPVTQLINTICFGRNSISPKTAGRGCFVIALSLTVFALLPAPKALGVTPAPDGGYPNHNTAEGTDALFSLTTGANNTAIGFDALYSNTEGLANTAIGYAALGNDTTGGFNTAIGGGALGDNTTGAANTAIGGLALELNQTGANNTAIGNQALFKNTADNNTATGSLALSNNITGAYNTANGFEALNGNTGANYNTATGALALLNNTGAQNTATGTFALQTNNTGQGNTATGLQALFSNTSGSSNTAEGMNALLHNTTGSNNTGLGVSAGGNLTTGSNNIDIGANVLGNAGEANTIRIGKQGTQKSTFVAGIFGTPVTGSTAVVNSNGKLGVATSSARFKEQIRRMGKASETILALKPVSFRYKEEIDPDGRPQFGLIAEEVEKVNPDLVGRDQNGKVATVRYEAVNAMLLNEFLKEHRKVEQLERILAKQETTNATQQKQIEALTTAVQRVQLEVNKAAVQMAANHP